MFISGANTRENMIAGTCTCIYTYIHNIHLYADYRMWISRMWITECGLQNVDYRMGILVCACLAGRSDVLPMKLGIQSVVVLLV